MPRLVSSGTRDFFACFVMAMLRHTCFRRVVALCVLLLSSTTLLLTPSSLSASDDEGWKRSVAMPEHLQTQQRDRILELYDDSHAYGVDQQIRYWEDTSGKATIDDILSNKHEKSFNRLDHGTLSFGYTDSHIWVKIPMVYKGGQKDAKYWFEVNTPLLDDATVYLVELLPDDSLGQVIKKYYAGYETPLSERDIMYPSRVFELTLEPNHPVMLVAELSSGHAMHLPINIYSAKGMAERFNLVTMFYALCLGATLVMVAYNTFIYISVREKAYYYYVLYIAFYFIALLCERIYGLQIAGEVPEFLHKKYLAFYVWVTFYFAFIMSRYFLNAQETSENLDWLIRIFAYISASSAAISFFADPSTSAQWAVIGTIFNTLAVCGFGLFAMKRKLPGSGIFVTAWLFNFSGLTLYALAVSGQIPFNLVTWNAPQLGIICQILLLSFALSDRIKIAQNKALEANNLAMKHLQRYQSLFDNAVEGIFQISLNRRFTDANPAMVSMLGYGSLVHMQKSVTDALQACYQKPELVNAVIKQLEAGNIVQNMEASYLRNGEIRWAISSLRVVTEEDAPTVIEGSFVDITEEKEKEQIAREREQDRLQRKVAEASAQAKTQFLANMSHEIRTPLTAIIGYSESMQDDTLQPDERDNAIDTVIKSGKHLLELINDILDHSKIDANKLEVEVLPISLVELLSEIKSYFHIRAQEKGLEFNVQYDFPLPDKISTDPTRLKQILINLCGNALKFTERGSIRVNVRCDRDNEMLYLRVVDTGIGLKPEHMSRLFDPFAQADASTARQYGGTGLGLNISKRLAELLGGTIRATSTYGQGSEFEVSVATGPLTSVTFIQDGSELNRSHVAMQTVKAPKLRGRILYAEDNEVNRKLIEMLVRKTGADIKVVINGAEALKAATTEAFDLILMDIQMPVMDGRDATLALRKSGNNVPIVALTANIMAEDIRDYKDAGCNDCLAKPVDKHRFYDTLCYYLEEAGEVPDFPQFEGKVLVAEDNRDNQMLIRRYLTKTGVKVAIANNGQEAVQQALQEPMDLILMDHHMPLMEGPEAIRMLRQTGYTRPIYSFTASDSKDDLDELASAGSDGIVSKPVDRKKLYEVLAKYLPKARTSQAVQAIEEGEGEDDELKPIIEQFVRGLPDRISQMQTHADNDAWDEVRKVAHQIKGIGGSLGYPQLTEKGKALDMAIKEHQADRYADLLADLLSDAQHVIDTYPSN